MTQRTAHGRRLAPALSALRDGDLGGLRAAYLRWHVGRCQTCLEILHGLDRQVAALRQLKDTPAAPPPAGDGWLAVRTALQATPVRRSSRLGRLGPVPLWVGSAAGVVLIVGGLWARQHALFERPPNDDEIIGLAEEQFRQAELPYQQALDRLTRAAQARADWTAAERQAQQDALLAYQRKLDGQRQAARSRPADMEAQEALYHSYQQQIDYLQDALMSGPAPIGEGDL